MKDGTLIIQCFPGDDHVRHHAAILSTYLRIFRDEDAAHRVFFTLPTAGETIRAIEASNLKDLPKVDIAVLGLVHRLGTLTAGGTWEGGAADPFGWTVHQFGTKRVAFVGFRPSYWGTIAGDLVRVLAGRGVEQVLYFGKLGSLIPDVMPNRWLATGNESYVDGATIQWHNILECSLGAHPVQFGRHYTLPSVLFETKAWLKGAQSNYQLVDPEVGHMAKAALKAGVKFGYIHIISDNVAKKYAEDLSNERLSAVLKGRGILYDHVNEILGAHLRLNA